MADGFPFTARDRFGENGVLTDDLPVVRLDSAEAPIVIPSGSAPGRFGLIDMNGYDYLRVTVVTTGAAIDLRPRSSDDAASSPTLEMISFGRAYARSLVTTMSAFGFYAARKLGRYMWLELMDTAPQDITVYLMKGNGPFPDANGGLSAYKIPDANRNALAASGSTLLVGYDIYNTDTATDYHFHIGSKSAALGTGDAATLIVPVPPRSRAQLMFPKLGPNLGSGLSWKATTDYAGATLAPAGKLVGTLYYVGT